MQRCIELMTSGQWITGRSAPQVATEFGVALVTAEQWASSASRVVRLALEDGGARENIRARMVATLETIVSTSLTADHPLAAKTAVAAIAEQAKLLGLSVQTHKVDMTVQQYEQLPPAALREKLLEQRARIDEAIARLDTELAVATTTAPVAALTGGEA